MKSKVKSLFSNILLSKLLATLRSGGLVVLMYHDLRKDDDFENWMRVSESDFHFQLSQLKIVGDFIGPEEVSMQPRGRRLRFLLTFDDGYCNNFKLAVPILDSHQVPAIFFISTQHMQEQLYFWPDIIITPIQALHLAQLNLSQFGLGNFSFRPVGSDGRWADIQKLLVSLKALGNISHPTVAAVLEFMKQTYSNTLKEHLPKYRPILESEVREMSTNSLFSFGSHAHNHEILTYQNEKEAFYNLQTSKKILEDITGQNIKSLAYPNGDFDSRIINLAKNVGYVQGYTTKAGLLDRRGNPMIFPRLGVGGVGSKSLPIFSLNLLLTGRS